MKRTVTVLFVIIMLSCSQQDGRTDGISSLGFYSSSSDIIKELGSRKNKSWAEHFLLARAYHDEKKYKSAMLHYANSCFTSHRDNNLTLYAQPVYEFVSGYHFKSPLYDESVYKIGELFFNYMEYDYVIKFVNLLGSDGSVRYRDAKILMAKAQERKNRFNDAMETLTDLENEYEDSSSRQLIRIRLASVKEKKDDMAGAIDWYMKVLELDVSTWQAGIAARRIHDISNESGIKLDSGQQLLLARGLYHVRRYGEASAMLMKLDDGTARYYLVRSLVHGGRRKDAEKVIDKYRGTEKEYYKLLSGMADELWSMGRRYNALSVYKKLLKADHRERKEALRKIAFYQEERNRADFINYARMYVKDYPDDPWSEDLLWLMARDSLSKGNKKSAMNLLERSVKSFPNGNDADRARFWLVKLYESVQRKEDAMKMEAELLSKHPGSSYTWLHMAKMSGRNTVEKLQKVFEDALENNNENEAQNAHLMLLFMQKDYNACRERREKIFSKSWVKRYVDLVKTIEGKRTRSEYADHIASLQHFFQVGYLEGIRREVTILPDSDDVTHDRALMAYTFGSKYGHHAIAVQGILDLFRKYDVDENISLLPEQVVSELLPLAFKDCVEKASSYSGIDKKMIYSVIKAESLYNPQAVSPAGAVGLMQLMPATARDIARQMKMKSYDLKDPCTSIKMGAHYLKWLKGYFDNDFEDMVAGYNAGAGNVNKWKKKRDYADDDYFIALLPFDETRGYILRTRKFHMQYEIVYNDR